MEAMLQMELANAAHNLGLSVSSPEFVTALQTGLYALAEGHSFDVAIEVARTGLSAKLQAVPAA